MATVYLSTSELAAESVVQGPSGTRLSLSPFDVPRSMTIDIEPQTRNLRIRLQYSDSEPTVERRLDDVKAEVGKHSGKILSLLLRTGRTPAAIRMTASQALRNWALQPGRDNQRMHYGLVANLFDIPPVQEAMAKVLATA